MLIRPPGGASAGFTMIEILIALTVLGIVMAIGLPNISIWIQNTQLKTAAEGAVSGLQLARAEALRRNQAVRFQLVDTVENGCALSSTGTSWVVSLMDPTGGCGAAASDTDKPFIVQKKSGAEGSPNARLAGVGGDGTNVTFNGLGRPNGVNNLTQIDISNPTGGKCIKDGGPMRCLGVQISTGGQVRMCDTDPAIPASDPRFC